MRLEEVKFDAIKYNYEIISGGSKEDAVSENILSYSCAMRDDTWMFYCSRDPKEEGAVDDEPGDMMTYNSTMDDDTWMLYCSSDPKEEAARRGLDGEDEPSGVEVREEAVKFDAIKYNYAIVSGGSKEDAVSDNVLSYSCAMRDDVWMLYCSRDPKEEGAREDEGGVGAGEVAVSDDVLSYSCAMSDEVWMLYCCRDPEEERAGEDDSGVGAVEDAVSADVLSYSCAMIYSTRDPTEKETTGSVGRN